MNWTPELLASIPDDLLRSEVYRRNARMRKTYTGGVYWKRHNPDYNGCRCRKCMNKRAAEKGAPA